MSSPARSVRRGLVLVLAAALASRVLVLCCFLFVGSLKDSGFAFGDIPFPPLSELAGKAARSAVSYGDFGWYKQVAEQGYARAPFSTAVQQNWGFFPLHPMLLKLVPAGQWQFLVGQLSFFGGVAATYLYLARWMRVADAIRAMLLLAFFPFSYVLSQFRPDSLLFCLVGLALLLASSRRPWLSVPASFLAGLAKPNGFLVSILLAPHVIPPGRPWWRNRSMIWRGAVLAAPVAGLFIMSALSYEASGEPLAWAKIQAAWQAEFLVRPWKELTGFLAQPLLLGSAGWDAVLLNAAIVLGAVAATAGLVRRRYPWLALYLALYVGLTFLNFGTPSIGKHVAAAFPYFLGLGLVFRGGAWALLLCLSAGVLALNSALSALGVLYTTV